MDEVRMSKSSIRAISVALAVVVMLIAGTMITNVDAAASPVTLASDISSGNVMVGDYLIATLTLSSSDTTYRSMEVYLVASWASGAGWTTYFMDTDLNPLDDDKISLSRPQPRQVPGSC